MSFIGDLFGGGDAAEASRDAADTQARYQREALQYLQRSEALPMAYRDAALRQLGALYGLKVPAAPISSRPGGTGVGGLSGLPGFVRDIFGDRLDQEQSAPAGAPAAIDPDQDP